MKGIPQLKSQNNLWETSKHEKHVGSQGFDHENLKITPFHHNN